MACAAPDSIYARERSYYLDLLQRQIYELRFNPDSRLQVVSRLGELLNLTPGYIEASNLLQDTCFHQICCTLNPILQNAMVALRADNDPSTGYKVSDELENAVPLMVRDPLAHARAEAGRR